MLVPNLKVGETSLPDRYGCCAYDSIYHHNHTTTTSTLWFRLSHICLIGLFLACIRRYVHADDPLLLLLLLLLVMVVAVVLV